MCCCLVGSVCRSSQCLTRSHGVFPSASRVLGRDLSLLFLYSGYRRHLWVQVLKCCVPVASATLCHQRAQGAGSLRREEECGCAPALPAVLARNILGCCFWRDWDTGCVSCFSLHPAGGPRAPVCYTLLFHLLWPNGHAVKLPGFYRCFTCLYLALEREWGREVSEWLAAPSNRKIIQTSSSTVKFSVKGRAPCSQLWLQGQRIFFLVPLVLERACVFSQKTIESFLCSLMCFYRYHTDRKLYHILQTESCKANKDQVWRNCGIFKMWQIKCSKRCYEKERHVRALSVWVNQRTMLHKAVWSVKLP